MIAVSILLISLSTLPVIMIAVNSPAYCPLAPATSESTEPISILIPARNEQINIAQAIESVLQNSACSFELIVLDDHSSDQTAAIVEGYSRIDSRVRLVSAPPLADGWCGKQHACWVLSKLARHDLLMWIDADVTLESKAINRVCNAMQDRTIGLLSGFPRQVTAGWLDTLLIPLIHFVLLGYLPIRLMRRTNDPAISAGCGQLFVARRSAYEAAGGHEAIRSSMHDGIQLPRSFRRAGESTDLFDATDAAACRMYDSSTATWNGLLKNAGEGIATFGGIFPWTLLLGLGTVAPPILAVIMVMRHAQLLYSGLMIFAWSAQLVARIHLAMRFKQSVLSALLHPLGIVLLLIIQWQSIVRRLSGTGSSWKGRVAPIP